MSDSVDVLIQELKNVNTLDLPTKASDIICNENILNLSEGDLKGIGNPANDSVHSLTVTKTRQQVKRIVELARECLLTTNNSLVPSAAGKLRKSGFAVVTYKCSETPGNVAVLIRTEKGMIEIADDFHWTRILQKAVNWPVSPEPESKPRSLWSKLFG